MVFPFGEKATEFTEDKCPRNVEVLATDASHSLAVLSQLPESIVLPSGEKATEFTGH